ncbi:Hsp70 family protein [Streptomyces armeniacus]|nr:Hsp70 family protein [Streptomyces armeniacus]
MAEEETLSLGIDLGSTGLRAAYAAPGGGGGTDGAVGRAPRTVEVPEGPWPWPLWEGRGPGAGTRTRAGARSRSQSRSHSPELPVAFGSLKNMLGDTRTVTVGGESVTPQEAVTRALRTVRERAEAEASRTVGQTVISVPARYESARRIALRDAAAAAGLEQVRLVTDSVAAVVGHTEKNSSSTVLVFGMGYGGFELGLVRSARGHFRALGYESGAAPAAPCGAAFDREILAAALHLARVHPELADTTRWDETDWQRLRTRAERAKEELAAAPGPASRAAVALTLDSGARMRMEIRRADFAAYLGPQLAPVRRSATALLDQTGLTVADVETVLLVGGSTAMPAVRALAEPLGDTCVAARPELLAYGAALHAEFLSRTPVAAPDDRGVPVVTDDALGADTDGPPLVATVRAGTAAKPSERTEPPGRPEPPDGPEPPEPSLAEARRLLAEGRTEDASAQLHQLVAEARTLLEEIDGAKTQAPWPSPPDPLPEPALPDAATAARNGTERDRPSPLAPAHALLEKRQYEQAVRASHAAWAEEPTHPDVFEGMIEVHCAAAMAEDGGGARFEDAERWLRCAYGHDATNTRIRDLLAERTYAHAVELHRQGEHREAVEALKKSLSWGPEHRASRDLLTRLTRRPGRA